jgi:hypothetical protein
MRRRQGGVRGRVASHSSKHANTTSTPSRQLAHSRRRAGSFSVQELESSHHLPDVVGHGTLGTLEGGVQVGHVGYNVQMASQAFSDMLAATFTSRASVSVTHSSHMSRSFSASGRSGGTRRQKRPYAAGGAQCRHHLHQAAPPQMTRVAATLSGGWRCPHPWQTLSHHGHPTMATLAAAGQHPPVPGTLPERSVTRPRRMRRNYQRERWMGSGTSLQGWARPQVLLAGLGTVGCPNPLPTLPENQGKMDLN